MPYWLIYMRSGGCLELTVAVQSLSHVRLFVIPWSVAHQSSLSIISQSLLKLMSIKSGMPSNHLILCHPLFLLPSIFPSIRVFSNELAVRIRWPKDWSFSFSITPPDERLIRNVWNLLYKYNMLSYEVRTVSPIRYIQWYFIYWIFPLWELQGESKA